jgi:hypothetical protein
MILGAIIVLVLALGCLLMVQYYNKAGISAPTQKSEASDRQPEILKTIDLRAFSG